MHDASLVHRWGRRRAHGGHLVMTLAASMLLGAGCSSRPSLADFPDPELTVRLDPRDRNAVVTILPRKDVLPESQSPCKLPAPKARATLNGVPLTRQTGRRGGNDRFYDFDCVVSFTSSGQTIPDSNEAATLRVEDDSAVWTLAIPEAFALRRLALVSPAGGVVHRGGDVVLQWLPVSDHIADVTVVLQAGAQESTDSVAVRGVKVLANGGLALHVPESLSAGWRGRAWIRGTAQVNPRIGPCPARRCSVTVLPPQASISVALED